MRSVPSCAQTELSWDEKTGVRYVVTNRELSEKLDWPEGTEILVMEGMEEGQENVRMPEAVSYTHLYIRMCVLFKYFF